MANITGQGRPTRTLKANKGDIYTDANTGVKYECLGPDGFVDVEGVDEPEYYDWKEIKTASGGGASDCDWNIMKNKPFGEIVVDRYDCMENARIAFTPQGMDEPEYLYYYASECSLLDTMTKGDKIITIIDGKTYECLVEVEPTYGTTYFGNLNIIHYSEYDGGAYPDFPILCIASGNPGGCPSIYADVSLGEEHTVSIYMEKTRVTKISEDYIPESIARTGTSGLTLVRNDGASVWITAGTTMSGVPYVCGKQFVGELPELLPHPIVHVVGEYVDENGNTFMIPLNYFMNRTVIDNGVNENGETLTTVSYSFYPTMAEAIDHDVQTVVYSDYQFKKMSM